MAMLPHEYMQLYREMKVPIVGDDDQLQSLQPVDVHKYLLALQDGTTGSPEHYNIQGSANAMGTLESKLNDFFKKPKASLTVFVGPSGTESKTFKTAGELWYFARKAYWGKACPEEIQITLQLVVRFGMERAENLQAYCDKGTDDLAQGRIGLDCNGFVGNYIDHGFHGTKWDAVTTSDYTANQGIESIMNGLGPEVKSLDDIKMLQTYVMGLVDPATGRVINRFAGSLTGHIVVTSPFTFLSALLLQSGIVMQAVESTHDAGLTESNYELLSGKNYVFEVRRGSKIGTPYEKEKFRIRPLN